MPSATHQNFLLLFRHHPELVFELARRAGAPVPSEYDQIDEVAPEFDDPLLIGNTVTADLALVGSTRDRPRQALVFEIQLGVDPSKEWTIVLYRASLRRRLECPAWAIFFSPVAKVREAMFDRMFIDEPELRPLVITPEMVPVLPSLDAALADYRWAVLAAVMHATGPAAIFNATIAVRALLDVAPRDYGRYIQLVAASIGKEAMQKVREQLPAQDREELSEWERQGSSFVTGLEEGLEQGLEQGREQGLRTALQTVLETRGLIPDATVRGRIDTANADELRALIIRASTITDLDDLR